MRVLRTSQAGCPALPVEMLDAVISLTDMKSLKRVVKAGRLLRDLARPYLFKHLHVNGARRVKNFAAFVTFLGGHPRAASVGRDAKGCAVAEYSNGAKPKGPVPLTTTSTWMAFKRRE